MSHEWKNDSQLKLVLFLMKSSTTFTFSFILDETSYDLQLLSGSESKQHDGKSKTLS